MPCVARHKVDMLRMTGVLELICLVVCRADACCPPVFGKWQGLTNMMQGTHGDARGLLSTRIGRSVLLPPGLLPTPVEHLAGMKPRWAAVWQSVTMSATLLLWGIPYRLVKSTPVV
jgi:hypothetical protein